MSPDAPDGADRHADELLSAWLDGELDPAQTEWVDAHLRSCEGCTAAAEAVGATRSLVRGLPMVDARPLVERILVHHRRVIRAGITFVGSAAVVAGALALTAAVTRDQLVPDVESMVLAHEAASHAVLMEVRPVEDVTDDYEAPMALASGSLELRRHSLFDGADLVAATYRGDDLDVSIFEQPGSVAWDELPSGEMLDLSGRTLWISRGQPTVVVAERGHLVVTAVSNAEAVAVQAVLSVPEHRRNSTWDRVHDACQRFVTVFSLGD